MLLLLLLLAPTAAAGGLTRPAHPVRAAVRSPLRPGPGPTVVAAPPHAPSNLDAALCEVEVVAVAGARQRRDHSLVSPKNNKAPPVFARPRSCLVIFAVLFGVCNKKGTSQLSITF